MVLDISGIPLLHKFIHKIVFHSDSDGRMVLEIVWLVVGASDNPILIRFTYLLKLEQLQKTESFHPKEVFQNISCICSCVIIQRIDIYFQCCGNKFKSIDFSSFLITFVLAYADICGCFGETTSQS